VDPAADGGLVFAEDFGGFGGSDEVFHTGYGCIDRCTRLL
jgi:hypothetical protein